MRMPWVCGLLRSRHRADAVAEQTHSPELHVRTPLTREAAVRGRPQAGQGALLVVQILP